MKKVILLMLFSHILISTQTNAQVKVSVNVNVNSQPNWGPTGYDHVDYYYMPDIDAYYDVPQRQFIYLEGKNWVFAASLPVRYHNYDLYRGYKVVINEPRPYMHHEVYHVKYAKYRNCYDKQATIHGNGKYKDHREDDDDDQGPGNHGKGHAYGHYKHKDKDRD